MGHNSSRGVQHQDTVCGGFKRGPDGFGLLPHAQPQHSTQNTTPTTIKPVKARTVRARSRFHHEAGRSTTMSLGVRRSILPHRGSVLSSPDVADARQLDLSFPTRTWPGISSPERPSSSASTIGPSASMVSDFRTAASEKPTNRPCILMSSLS